MIYREMPAVWEPSFRPRFYATWGRESAVIYARARRAEYQEYEQLLSIKAAIELPNLIARGDEYAGEMDRFAPEVVTGLRERGMELRAGRAENSGFHAVVRHSDGTYEGAADSRREGVVKILPPDR